MIRFERLSRPMVSISGRETGQKARIYRLFLGPVVLSVEFFEYPLRWERRNTPLEVEIRSPFTAAQERAYSEWYVRTHKDPR